MREVILSESALPIHGRIKYGRPAGHIARRLYAEYGSAVITGGLCWVIGAGVRILVELAI
jgi:hypothetical protein